MLCVCLDMEFDLVWGLGLNLHMLKSQVEKGMTAILRVQKDRFPRFRTLSIPVYLGN